jgi:hypothetical protein
MQAQVESTLTARQVGAIALAINADEVSYCSYTKNPKVLSYMKPRQPVTPCDEEFRKAIKYKPVILTASGQKGVIVSVSSEFLMGGFCGAGGHCPLHILQETADGYRIVLDEIGTTQSIIVTKQLTRGFYNIVIHGGTPATPMNTVYSWNGSHYANSELAAEKVEHSLAQTVEQDKPLIKSALALGLHSGETQARVKAMLAEHGYHAADPSFTYDARLPGIWFCFSAGWQGGEWDTGCVARKGDISVQLFFELGKLYRNPDTAELYQVKTDRLVRADFKVEVTEYETRTFLQLFSPTIVKCGGNLFQSSDQNLTSHLVNYLGGSCLSF